MEAKMFRNQLQKLLPMRPRTEDILRIARPNFSVFEHPVWPILGILLIPIKFFFYTIWKLLPFQALGCVVGDIVN